MVAGKYLYCVIRAREPRVFPGATPVGSTAGPVYSIPHGGLALVVSDTSVQQYEHTRATLLAHERVQERVMQEYTILPVRFGTVADGEHASAQIRHLLEKRREEFERLLEEMEGKAEFGIKGMWKDERAVIEKVVAQHEPIRRLRHRLMGKSAEATHFERIRLGEMIKEALDRKRASIAARIMAPLRSLAPRSVENALLGERMVVNAAFLVERAREQEFDETVSRLASEFEDLVTLRYIGPAPPYNFVNITVSWRDL